MKAASAVVVVLVLVVVLGEAEHVPPHTQRNKDVSWHSVCQEGASWRFVVGKNTSCAATGYFDDTIATKGWSYLFVQTNEDLDDGVQSFAAGYLEGAVAQHRNYQSKLNQFYAMFNRSAPAAEVQAWVDTNVKWTKQQITLHASSDPYWHQVKLAYDQLEGLSQGYAAVAPSNESLTYNDFLLMNLVGDMGDIQAAVAYASQPPNVRDTQWQHMSLPKVLRKVEFSGRCSALIKPVYDASTHQLQDLFFAHTTWGPFCTMLRTFKFYHVAGRSIHFSSYPAVLVSNDDFYLIKEPQLAVMETTNDIINMSLYKYVQPTGCVPCWVRTLVANHLAVSGQQWSDTFARYNSGTYNNQWMIADYKLLASAPRQLPPNSVWIVSQIPGSTASQDVSSVINAQGYWASYNRPYIPKFYNVTGYQLYKEKYGEYYFGYKNYFRGLIFRREQSTVVGVDDMKRTMTYNRWKTDPLSHDMAGFSISARFDLQQQTPPVEPSGWFIRGTHGGIDTKITSSTLMKTLGTVTQCGPTTGSSDTPPFTWSGEWAKEVHAGHPDVFNFPFVKYELPG